MTSTTEISRAIKLANEIRQGRIEIALSEQGEMEASAIYDAYGDAIEMVRVDSVNGALVVTTALPIPDEDTSDEDAAEYAHESTMLMAELAREFGAHNVSGRAGVGKLLGNMVLEITVGGRPYSAK